MILYKTIALKFGHHLENEVPVDMHGPDGQRVSSDEIRQHWQAVFSDLSSARIYLLDHNAANYLDSLRMDVQGLTWEDHPESDIQNYVRVPAFFAQRSQAITKISNRILLGHALVAQKRGLTVHGLIVSFCGRGVLDERKSTNLPIL